MLDTLMTITTGPNPGVMNQASNCDVLARVGNLKTEKATDVS